MWRLGGWDGAWRLLILIAGTVALPAVFGTGWRAVWDWSALFIGLAFVVIPALCLVHVGVTIVVARIRSGRACAIALASLVVPFGYFAVAYVMLT